MSRSTLNFCIDACLACILLIVLTTTAILRFVFPAAGESAGWTLWGIDYWQLSHFRDVALLLFAINVLVHLIFHWTWVFGFVVARVCSRRGTKVALSESDKTLYGVSTLIVILTLCCGAIAAAEFAISSPPAETSESGLTTPDQDPTRE